MDPATLYGHQKRHLEHLKTQIARYLDKEMSLKLEERRDRARQLGIDWIDRSATAESTQVVLS